MSNLRRTAAYLRALRRATPTITEVARQIGVHRNTVSRFLNSDPPTAAAVSALATWLRNHAQKLIQEADQLEGRKR